MAIPTQLKAKLYLEPGTLITCPKCGAHIAELIEVLRMGQKIDAEKFNMLQYGHGNGTTMACKECDSDFVHVGTGSLHTSTGWEPPLPRDTWRG